MRAGVAKGRLGCAKVFRGDAGRNLTGQGGEK